MEKWTKRFRIENVTLLIVFIYERRLFYGMSDMMTNNLSMIIDHLRPYLGDTASEFVAMELLFLNRQYVDIDYDPIMKQSSVHCRTPDLPHMIQEELLANLRRPLEIIIGPYKTTKLLDALSYELTGRKSGMNSKPHRILNHAA